MKVLLGNPPWAAGSRRGVRAGSRWPFTVKLEKEMDKPRYIPFPFFLAYSTAVLEADGHDVKLIDGIADGITTDEFLSEVKKFSPDLAVMETSTPSIDVDLETARSISEMGAQVAFCGPHASALSEVIMRENTFIDYVLVGEYDYTLRDLAESLEKNKSLKDVSGLLYRDAGRMVVNERRPLIKDIDALPWPARHQLNMMNYVDGFAGMPLPSLQMWASRGCPYQCIFCLWPRVMYGGSSYRPRDPVDIVEEMSAMIGKYGFKSVYFDDDTFNIGADRISRICGEIKGHGIDVPWAVMARADTSDYKMLDEMADAGLYAIKYGVESGVQELVDNAHKNLDLGRVEKTVEYTKRLGVKTHLTFTFGLPGETWDTVRKTMDFAFRLEPDSVQFSIVTPFPGTEYYDTLDGQGCILSKNWRDYDGTGSAVFKTDAMSQDDLRKACEMAQEEWVYRKRRLSSIPGMFYSLSRRDGLLPTALRFAREAPKYVKHRLDGF
ncbi:MAG: radical SAM protein [Candidatus Altiarchaeota archaeon]